MSAENLEVGMSVKVSAPYEGKDSNGNEKFGFDEITGVTMKIEYIFLMQNRLPEFMLSNPSMRDIYWVLGTSRLTKV